MHQQPVKLPVAGRHGLARSHEGRGPGPATRPAGKCHQATLDRSPPGGANCALSSANSKVDPKASIFASKTNVGARAHGAAVVPVEPALSLWLAVNFLVELAEAPMNW